MVRDPGGKASAGLERVAVRPRLLLLLFLLLAAPAPAREWFRPVHAGPAIANPDLTPARALRGPVRPGWRDQMVLWEGRIRRHEVRGGQPFLVLATEAGEVPVRFPRPARNLEYDRTGYRVAVKGLVTLQEGRFAGLEGRSVILLEPPRAGGYPQWLGSRRPDLVSFLGWRIHFHNPESAPEEVETTARNLVEAARTNALDPLLLASLVQIESAWDADAVSPSGALGLGQLMPFTADGLGVDPRDPGQNLAGAARMLGRLLQTWEHLDNPRAAALSGYNAGPNRVLGLGGGVPAVPETVNYVYFIGYVLRDMTRVARTWRVLSPE